MTNNWLSASDPYFAQFSGGQDESGYYSGPYDSVIAGLSSPENWKNVVRQLGYTGPIDTSVISTDPGEGGGGYVTVPAPEFLNFIKQKKAEGYDFVTKADQLNKDRQTIGFRTPTGEVVNQTPVKVSGFGEFFKEFVLPVAMTVIGLPGYGNLNQVIGSTIMGAETAANIGANLGLSGDVVQRAIGSSVMNAGLTGAGGGSLEDVVRSGLGSLAAPVVSNVVGQGLGAISPPDFDPNLGQLASPIKNAAQGAITSGALAAITGASDPSDAALGSLAGSAVGALGKETGLPPSVIKGALDFAKTGEVSPVDVFKGLVDIKKQSETPKQVGSNVRAEGEEAVTGEGGDVFGVDDLTDVDASGSQDATAGGRAEQKRQMADYIRQQAESKVEGFEVDQNGNLSVIDADNGLLHRFAPDGSAIETHDLTIVPGGGATYPITSQAVKDFLSSDYVSTLFGGASDTSQNEGLDTPKKYLRPEATSDDSGLGGQATGSAYTQEDLEMMKQELLEEQLAEQLEGVNPPVTMPSTDVDTTADYGQAVFSDLDRILASGSTGQGQSGAVISDPVDRLSSSDYGQSVSDELDRVLAGAKSDNVVEEQRLRELDEQLTPDRQDTVREAEQDIVREDEQDTVREAERDTVREPDPSTVREDEQDTVREDEQDTVREPDPSTVREDEQDIVREPDPSTVREDEQDIVREAERDTAQGADPGITAERVQEIVSQTLRDNPSLSVGQVQDIVDSAVKSIPPGLTPEDMSRVVNEAINRLPQAPTAQDIDTAVTRALTGVATQADVRQAIQNIQFPEGINQDDVARAISDYMEQNPGLTAQQVAQQVGEQLKQLPDYATPADVESAIEGAMTNVATRADVEKAIQGIQFPDGISRDDVKDVITQYMRDNPGLSAAEVTSLVGDQLNRLPDYATPQDVVSSIRSALAGYATSEDVAGLGRGLEAVRGDLTQLIADAQASGLKGDAALNASLEALAGELGMTRQGLLGSLGATEQSLRSDFATQLGGVSTQIGDVESRLLDKIAAAQSVGLQGDAALTAGLESLAADLGTTQASLLSQMGTNEQALRAQFSAELGGVRGEVGRLGQDLQSAISDAIASGLQGDAALQAGLDALAGNLGTTRTDLLSQLGTTEQALRADLGAQLTGVQSQVTQLGSELSRAIEAARAEGLQGEEALRAGLNSLAGELGTTKDDLLSRLGTSEQALRSDFASQLGGVQSQVAQLGSSLSDAIADARASGLQGDAALQAGLDALAGSLGTTQGELLSQLGTTEEALKRDFSSQITGVESQVSQLGSELNSAIAEARAAGLQGDAALQAGLDTLAGNLGTTKDDLLSQLGQTEQSLRSQFQSSIGGLEAELTGQIGGLRQDVQEQYDMLSEDQQAEVARRVQLGEDLTKAIGDVESGLTETIAGVEAGITKQITNIDTRIDELMDRGLDYQEATDLALREVSGELGALSESTEQAVAGSEKRLSDRIDQLRLEGLDWQTASSLALEELSQETGSSISALGLDIGTQIEELQRQQDEADVAAAAAAAEQTATQERLAEEARTNAINIAARQSAERGQQGLLSLGSSFASRGAASPSMDPYKATFLAPFIVGGQAPGKFEGPLSGFLKEATTGDFLAESPRRQESRQDEEQDTVAQAYTGGQGPSNPLDMYEPEKEYQGLYGFRAGGIVPLMAQGGTRYGNNAHGALRVLEHSGKTRADYRQGDAVTGVGDGQSDDIPAMLADGEFVIPADVVAALGNGSTKAGSDKLYDMMHNIRRHHRSTGPKDLPPPAKAPLEYIKARTGRSTR